MTAKQLIAMLQKLPPDTKILGWIDGGTICPHEIEELDYSEGVALLDFINTDEYAS